MKEADWLDHCSLFTLPLSSNKWQEREPSFRLGWLICHLKRGWYGQHTDGGVGVETEYTVLSKMMVSASPTVLYCTGVRLVRPSIQPCNPLAFMV
ncbi:MAG: hypothetical protein AAF639_31150 [Chloroflexota bacterium]